MLNIFKRTYFAFALKNDVNVSFGFPKVLEVEELLKQRKFAQISEVYNSLKNDEKTLLLDGICLRDDFIDLILEWHGTDQHGYVSNLFAATANNFLAWKIRSGERANQVSTEQFEGFWEKLDLAKQQIHASLKSHPNCSESYARLIRIHMGLEEKEEMLRCFDKLISVDSTHFGGHMFMCNALTPKWLGSFEELEEFTKSRMNQDDNGLLTVLYLIYVMEMYHELEDVNPNKAPEVLMKDYRNSVLEIYEGINIQAIPSYQRYYLHNYFSYLFYLMDDYKQLNKEIDYIGKNISFYPWAFRGVEGYRDLKIIGLN
jgi:hypothetical protein